MFWSLRLEIKNITAKIEARAIPASCDTIRLNPSPSGRGA